MKQARLIIDVSRCIDCNNCLLACKDEFVDNDWLPYSAAQPRHGHRWMNIMRKERGQYPLVDVAYRPTPCMHCEDADCIVAAEDGAIFQREDGIVLIDPLKAKGQQGVVDSCPFGAIWWNEELETPQKCTLCAHLLDDGWAEPRCVQSCATGALRFIYAEESEVQAQIAVEALEVLHPHYQQGPRVYYKNLYRYAACFIGGSLASSKGGLTDCVAGARVTLHHGATRIGETVSDLFGDFKFDRLEENSGRYSLEIIHPEYNQKTVEVSLGTSTNVGAIWLESVTPGW